MSPKILSEGFYGFCSSRRWAQEYSGEPLLKLGNSASKSKLIVTVSPWVSARCSRRR